MVSANEFNFTPTTTHRFVSCVWVNIRDKVLIHPKLDKHVHNTICGKMPKWWIVGDHNHVLLCTVE